MAGLDAGSPTDVPEVVKDMDDTAGKKRKRHHVPQRRACTLCGKLEDEDSYKKHRSRCTIFLVKNLRNSRLDGMRAFAIDEELMWYQI